jgi:hypothetical protein
MNLTHMKNTNLFISSAVASILCSGFAIAGPSTSAVQPAATTGITGYAKAQAVTGSGSLEFGGDSASEDISGGRLDAGILFGNGFSLDGRYEHVEAESNLNQDEARILLNYTKEIAPNFSAFVGAGYGTQQLDFTFGNLNSDGILANIGVEFTSGQFFGSLFYTHSFTTDASVSGTGGLGGGGLPSGAVEEEDIGYLEANLGYQLNERVALVASLQAQVVGDSIAQKDWLAGLGLRFGF